MNLLIWSLAINSVLLFCLLAPNIVMLIHSKFFEWKVEPKVKDRALMFSILQLFAMEHLPKQTPKELRDWFNKTVKFLLIPLLLLSCVPTEEEFLSKQEEHYEVLALYDSPYAYVTLQNMSTMKTFEDVYLSKICTNLNTWSKGDFISLTRYRYKTPTGVTESFSNAELNLKFCQ